MNAPEECNHLLPFRYCTAVNILQCCPCPTHSHSFLSNITKNPFLPASLLTGSSPFICIFNFSFLIIGTHYCVCCHHCQWLPLLLRSWLLRSDGWYMCCPYSFIGYNICRLCYSSCQLRYWEGWDQCENQWGLILLLPEFNRLSLRTVLLKHIFKQAYSHHKVLIYICMHALEGKLNIKLLGSAPSSALRLRWHYWKERLWERKGDYLSSFTKEFS